MTDGDPARLAAYRTVQAVSRDDAYANLVLPRLLTEAGLGGRDAALATELAYGTLRARGTLDEIIRRCCTRPLADVESGVLDLLRLGSYQLLKTRVPTHAAVATTVDLARATGNSRAAGFVNAVLRKVAARDFDGWCRLIGRDASPVGQLALRYSHPGWIVAAFAEALATGADRRAAHDELGATSDADERATAPDVDELEAALAADDARPETHLVAWPGAIERDELAEQAGGSAGPYSPYAVRLTGGGMPADLPAIKAGQAAVQDEGSQMCALALTRLPITGPDERWLDLCAGPGGKAALLAALAGDRRLTANELHPHRAELVRRATARWPVDIVIGDARDVTGSFDRILLDAPCTGLGALRRRPEARWRRSPDDLADLAALQAQLLDAAARLVRPGGVIGYVTCSPHPSETTDQIESALQRHPDLALLDARPAFPGVDQLDDRPTVQLWPHRHGTDAMFFAALQRRDHPGGTVGAAT